MNPSKLWKVSQDDCDWRIETIEGRPIALCFDAQIAERIAKMHNLLVASDFIDNAIEELTDFVDANEEDSDSYAHAAIGQIEAFFNQFPN